MKKLPHFFNYKEERADHGYETMQDFFLSWTIRCSNESYKNTNPILYEYARRIVFGLIYGENENGNYILKKEINNDFKVTSVKTKRQYKNIDLLVALEISFSEKVLLNIENKWYSKLDPNQLEKYNNFVKNEYPSSKISNLYITCDDCRKNYEEEKKNCITNNYKFLTIEHLFRIAGMDTGGKTTNYLFDEYWFKD